MLKLSNINNLKLESLVHIDDNNFKLARLLLSICVVFTHSYMLLDGHMLKDPLKQILQIKWGDLGYTTIFFLISGFLTTQSYFKHNRLWPFIKSRILRIYPAVFVANIFVILTCIILIKTNAFEYLFSKDVLYYLYRNTILIFDIRPRLGFGIFDTNPYPKIINAQWWTLIWNIKMYIVIIILFTFTKKTRTPLLFNFVLVLICFLSSLFKNDIGWLAIILPYFCTGIFFFINKKIIPINPIYFILAFCFYLLFSNTNLEPVLSPFLKGYILFYLIFVPKGWLTHFNKLGDYSYGIFLYHIFIQQLLIHFGVSDVLKLFSLSLLITFIIAFLSYHFIESKVLKFKSAEFPFINSFNINKKKNLNPHFQNNG